MTLVHGPGTQGARNKEQGAKEGKTALLIGQAWPPHPQFLITTGLGMGVWRGLIWDCHLPQCDRLLYLGS